MKELNRTDRLTIAALLFAVILVIGLVTLKKPRVPYAHSVEESLGLVISSTDVISPMEVMSISSQSDNNYYLVDVRNPIDYQKSHIGQAVNIPLAEILDNQNLKTFSKLASKNVKIIFYGKDQLEANGVWLILKQTGYDNILIMQGGFDYYIDQNKSLSTGNELQYLVEKQRYDFNTVLNSFGEPDSSSLKESPEPVIVIKKENKAAAEGGC